jgi:hypothetical protein
VDGAAAYGADDDDPGAIALHDALRAIGSLLAAGGGGGGGGSGAAVGLPLLVEPPWE